MFQGLVKKNVTKGTFYPEITCTPRTEGAIVELVNEIVKGDIATRIRRRRQLRHSCCSELEFRYLRTEPRDHRSGVVPWLVVFHPSTDSNSRMAKLCNTPGCDNESVTKTVGNRVVSNGAYCAKCTSERYRAKKPHSVTAGNLRARYGINIEEYEQMLEDQDGVCLICNGSPNRGARETALCVDHCHSTGSIRCLLCWRCNGALGLFEDDIERLNNAILYLRS